MKNKSFIGLLTLVFVFGLMSSMLIAGKNYNYKDKKGLRKPTDLHAAAQFDVNRISSWIINDGLFANDPPTGYSGLEYPKGSGNMAIYTAGMWLLGLTSDTHELRACAACYSTDLQPGKSWIPVPRMIRLNLSILFINIIRVMWWTRLPSIKAVRLK